MDAALARRSPGRPAGRQGADLLAVAREVFLTHGFGGTTMHEVAARAGISKTSLYREHESKDVLFAAIVTDWAAQGRGAMGPVVEQLLQAEDLHNALVDFAGILQHAVLAPDVVQMRRLVTAESDRFPEIAIGYLAASWDSNIAILADALAELHARGLIRIADPLVAAHQFTWTAVGAALNAHTIAGDATTTPPELLRRFATAAATSLIDS